MNRNLMPIMNTGMFIRFELLDAEQAMQNHGQTLEKLADRGGLDVSEALAVAEKRKWKRMPFAEAFTALSILAARAAHDTTKGGASHEEL